jgi:hypothetical protein
VLDGAGEGPDGQTANPMTTPTTSTSPHPRRPLRSTWAVVAGVLTIAVLSLGTDQLFHTLEVYPPWGQPMHDAGLNLLALSYRIVYGILGGYITARLAPHSPMRHALIGGVIGLVLSAAGALTAIRLNLGPSWYPIALALSAVPCAWLGGRWYEARRVER